MLIKLYNKYFCKCNKCLKYGDLNKLNINYMYFEWTSSKDNMLLNHIVTQCKNCNKLHLFSFSNDLSIYSTFFDNLYKSKLYKDIYELHEKFVIKCKNIDNNYFNEYVLISKLYNSYAKKEGYTNFSNINNKIKDKIYYNLPIILIDN